ncbi:UDP-glucuronosyltransferase 2A3-like [Rhopilema esculentum]|uniref:UDP-glucuronosyltransferase 2A3-like n=1 Tax=Rhopilema esculentum TaxID=499914 RepID=UPI0031D1CFEB|eukprot:gene8299-14260_t
MGVSSDVLVCTLVLATFLGHGDCRKAKSKVVFVTLCFESSPYFNSLELAEELVKRGLEVSILTTKHMKTRKSTVKHVEYQLPNPQLAEKMLNYVGAVSSRSGLSALFSTFRDLSQLFLDSCFAMLKNNDVLKEIENADMIVTISVMPCGHYIADMYDKPKITLNPSSLSTISSEAGVPNLASFVPMVTSPFSDEMSFLERVQNFIEYRIKEVIVNFWLTYWFRELRFANDRKGKGSYLEVFGNAEMVIVPLDFSYQYVTPIIPNVFFVGSFLTKPSKQLPEDLEEFMQSSGEHGVVLLAFGSAVCSMDQVIVERILTAISRMKQKFIWKMKLTENLTIPPNLKALKWVPQNDILGHEKTKAFVSHMGINGAAEAAYHGVPIVAAPFTAERLHNTVLFSKKVKMAKFIDILNADADTWQRTIEEVIYNSSYKEHAMMTSKRMRSWPKSGTEIAGDLVQYALDNGGRLPHLKSNANTLYWFQYYCVDVVAFLLALAVLLLLVFYKMLRLLISFLCGKRSKSKEE